VAVDCAGVEYELDTRVSVFVDAKTGDRSVRRSACRQILILIWTDVNQSDRSSTLLRTIKVLRARAVLHVC